LELLGKLQHPTTSCTRNQCPPGRSQRRETMERDTGSMAAHHKPHNKQTSVQENSDLADALPCIEDILFLRSTKMY